MRLSGAAQDLTLVRASVKQLLRAMSWHVAKTTFDILRLLLHAGIENEMLWDPGSN